MLLGLLSVKKHTQAKLNEYMWPLITEFLWSAGQPETLHYLRFTFNPQTRQRVLNVFMSVEHPIMTYTVCGHKLTWLFTTKMEDTCVLLVINMTIIYVYPWTTVSAKKQMFCNIVLKKKVIYIWDDLGVNKFTVVFNF